MQSILVSVLSAASILAVGAPAAATDVIHGLQVQAKGAGFDVTNYRDIHGRVITPTYFSFSWTFSEPLSAKGWQSAGLSYGHEDWETGNGTSVSVGFSGRGLEVYFEPYPEQAGTAMNISVGASFLDGRLMSFYGRALGGDVGPFSSFTWERGGVLEFSNIDPYSSIGDGQWSGSMTVVGMPGLTAPPVPEPATWAMMILGFGLTGAVARSRCGMRRLLPSSG